MSDVNAEHDEHLWASEQMAAALTGGLSGEERARFERHLRECEACAAAWEKLAAGEEKLAALFADARPAAGFEDRIIQSLRTGRAGRADRSWGSLAGWPGLRLVHPSVRFAAAGIAAAILVGAVGLVVNDAMENGGLPDIRGGGARRVATTAKLRKVGEGQLSLGIESPTTQPGAPADLLYNYDHSAAPDEIARQSVQDGTSNFSLGTSSSTNGDGGVVFFAQPNSWFKAQEKRESKGVDLKLDGGSAFGNESSARDRGFNVPRRSYWDVDSTSAGSVAGEAQAGKDANQPAAAGSLVLGGKVENFGAYRAINRGTDREEAVKQNNSGAYGDYVTLKAGEAPGAQAGDAPGPQAGPARMFRPGELGDLMAKKLDAREKEHEVAIARSNVAQLSDESRRGGTPAAKPTQTGSERTPALAPVALQVPDAPAPPPAPEPAPAPVPAPVPAPQAPQGHNRKIIRTGQMEFEVDRFDSAFAIVSKLVSEAGGYIGSTNSEKLPNGKVKGTVTVRVVPERLDTLVLQLRSLGDLKSQKLEAQDVSKQYQDLDSELTAARAMEGRLLEIIKTGKGEIKDLLAAEKELGVWRGKIEKIVGEMKFYDSQVALSTLAITMYEKDVNTAAAATETETIDAGVEISDVEKARADALKAIEEAKGRVLQSELKKDDAGQLSAVIVADVPPDRSGALLDRVKQLGKVARLQVQRKQSDAAVSAPGAAGPATRVERKDTRINLSIYNLTKVAARTTTTMTLAVDDADAAYRAVVARVEKAGGRVRESSLTRPKNEQVVGKLSFDVPAGEADAVAAELKAAGEVMNLSLADNPDIDNTTTAKRGFSVQILAAAGVAPRETASVGVAAVSVAEARNRIVEAARAVAARVLASQLNESDRQNITANLDLEVKREKLGEFEKAVAGAGDIISRAINRSADTENTIDSKVLVKLSIVAADRLAPRQTTMLAVEVRDVEAAVADVQALAATSGGKVAASNLSKDREGRTVGKVSLDIPSEKANDVVEHTRGLGTVRVFDSSRNPQAPEGKLARSRVDITFGNAEAIVAPGTGVGASIRNALATSVAGLLFSLQILIVGLCFVVPWVVVIWGGWKFVRRGRRASAGAVTAT